MMHPHLVADPKKSHEKHVADKYCSFCVKRKASESCLLVVHVVVPFAHGVNCSVNDNRELVCLEDG